MQGPYLTIIIFAGFCGLLSWHIVQRKNLLRRNRELKDKVDAVSEEVLMFLPLGIVVVDGTGVILWHNPIFSEIVSQEGTVRGKITQHLPELALRKHSWFPRWKGSQISVRGRIFRVESKKLKANDSGSRLLLTFEDVTEQVNMDQRCQEDRAVIGLIQIDNYSDAFQGIDDENRGVVLAAVDRLLSEWVVKLEGFLKKVSEDKYVLVMNQTALKECQKNRFELLDRVREISLGNKIPLTLSMGLGSGEETILDLSRLAHSGLDLALGRGGDQVVLKGPEKVLFYGGKSNAVEKKTKVRARVVAYTLKNHMQPADNVIIMGHENSDFDSAGASLGVAKIAMSFEKQFFLVMDNTSGALDKLFAVLKEHPEYAGKIISPKEALHHTGKNSLLVICDTQKPSFLVEPEILKNAGRVVLIDHHRRAEEFIEETQLSYVEPYASSTCELVTEILQYLSEEVLLDDFTASVLMAGMVVDTKNFVFQTGVRTFEAAGFLRRSGADPVLVRTLLQDDYATVLQRAEVIKYSEIIFDRVAVGILSQVVPHGAIIAAQTADILLTIEDVKASFVLYRVPDGVNISGRSNGEINVQVLLEQLGGGGHFNVAGAQMKGVSLEEARGKLNDLLEEYFKENQ